MRSLKLSIAASTLVCVFATTAFAQDAAPADAATAPADAATAPSTDTTVAPADTSATVTTNSADTGGKFVVGLRLGYGIPMGKLADETGAELSKAIKGNLPIWLDLGYMVTPNIMVGLYGQYGIGFAGSDIDDACDTDGVDCSFSVIRLGLQGQYHLSPAEKLDPWFGLGIGYEWLGISASRGSVSQDITYRGFELLNLQAGLDYKVMPALGIGPFLSFSLGQYGHASMSGDAADVSGDIDSKAFHEWLTLGVRGAFSI
jgi:outer membrane protein W